MPLQFLKPSISLCQGARMMFYAMTPNETAVRTLQEVPDYVQQATPFFIVMLVLEFFIGWVQKGWPPVRVNDGITSLSAGVLSRLPHVLIRSIELSAYVYVWNNFRVFELPWNSPWTWWLTFLGVDFGYYWLHRMAHEINIIWAAHQVHHSSEEYNLTTALRQSALQQFTSWIFYLPLALFIPPSVVAVHFQFNLLYQFWIHTKVISNLGPLELILNTPSHHRVHHGRNPYCIDANFGGALIIWDRIFGTFVLENDKVVYGITRPVNAFEPFWLQFHHYLYIWNSFWSTPGLGNKLSAIFKGPGWGPGKPRLGLREEVPKVTGKEVLYNLRLAASIQIYIIVHFILMLFIYQDMFETKATLSQIALLLRIGYIILTLTSTGFIMEQRRPFAAILETVRCCIFLILHKVGYLKTLIVSLEVATELVFLLSLAFWGLQSVRNLTAGISKHH
ncbi:alkylglycerol monooxygenase [Latimeria chalumnae]